ncbi:MAG: DNA repair protein RecO [Bacilli bacterium]|nr:DNA repair protein RecO [Bacilli bacterium]
MDINVQGIVLKQVHYKEKDCMITLLTENKIISFLARGILSPNSKNASSCLQYNLSEFTLSEKNSHLTLKQGKSIHTFKNLYENLDNISCVSLMSEATLKFIDEAYEVIYPYFKNILFSLEEGFDSATLLAIYLAQIIKYSGYKLEYDSCVECGTKKDIVSISYSSGGFLCKNCVNNNSFFAPSLLKSFRYVFMISSSSLKHYVLNKNDSYSLIKNFSSYLCDSFGEKELKSLDMYFCGKF